MRLPIVCAVIALAAACAAVPPAPPTDVAVVHVACTPNQALLAVKADAASRGWRIADEGLDMLVVDSGGATTRFKFDVAPRGTAVVAWDDAARRRADDDAGARDALLADCFVPHVDGDAAR